MEGEIHSAERSVKAPWRSEWSREKGGGWHANGEQTGHCARHLYSCWMTSLSPTLPVLEQALPKVYSLLPPHYFIWLQSRLRISPNGDKIGARDWHEEQRNGCTPALLIIWMFLQCSPAGTLWSTSPSLIHRGTTPVLVLVLPTKQAKHMRRWSAMTSLTHLPKRARNEPPATRRRALPGARKNLWGAGPASNPCQSEDDRSTFILPGIFQH